MAQPLVLVGAHIRMFINNTIYPVTQQVSFDYESGEYAIYGIDSPYPQELAGGGQIMIKGQARGVRIKNSGGLQAQNARPLFSDVVASPYISIRIEDRTTGEVILSLINAKISRIRDSVATKGTYKVDFDFIGQVPYFPLDLS